MAQPYLVLRTTRNGLFSHYVVEGSKNPLPLGMGSVKERINLLKNVYNEKMTDGQEGDVNIMCNLSEGIFEEGEKCGIEKGIAITVKNLLAMNKLTIGEIAEATGFSIEEIEKIRNHMQERNNQLLS